MALLMAKSMATNELVRSLRVMQQDQRIPRGYRILIGIAADRMEEHAISIEQLSRLVTPPR